MKKISFLMITVLFSTALLAQEPPVLGIKGGLNLAKWRVENSQAPNDMKTGAHLGLLAHIHLATKVAIQPEIQFSSQGTEIENNLGNEFTSKQNYINVPVMFQYMFNNGFRLEAGPYAGFLLSSKFVDENGTEDEDKNEFKKTDFGLGFGLNYLTYSGLGFGGRYNLGLTNINEERVNKTQHGVIQLSIFYMFDNAHKAKSR